VMVNASKQRSDHGRSRSATARSRAGWRRGVGITAVAVLTIAATVVPAIPAGAARLGTAVVLSEAATRGHGPWNAPGSDQEANSGGAANGIATPVLNPATAAQVKGVVMINTSLPYQNAQGAGTGMVLTSAGQVLTNYHVVEDASAIRVTVAATGRSYPATVVGSDQTDDVALLQLTDASGLSAVKVDDDRASVGDHVTAVGNAGGTGTLTAVTGTISSLDASVTAAAEGTLVSQTLTAMIETSADVVAGDSGGPLYDAEGEVVGIDTAASTGSEINGYAIPIQRALRIAAQIRSGDDSRTVRVGPAAFLGVRLDSYAAHQNPTDSGVGFEDLSGALVGGVLDGSAAARAGIEGGDVITHLGSRAISSADELSTALATYNPQDHVKITWIDPSGSQHSATVTLGSSPVA
jgi:S1-C subfamily serine protease